MSNKKDKKLEKPSKKFVSATQKYAKYSGIAIQMGLIIALFAYLGN